MNQPSDIRLIRLAYREYFGVEMKEYSQLPPHSFPDEKAYLAYLKTVLYFTKAVIEPLEHKGMKKSHSVIDIASGDGQMSLALALRGYEHVTLYDLDESRLQFGASLIKMITGKTTTTICASAVDLKASYDVLISYQTIEHLSDEGNYAVAKRKCQKLFLKAVDKNTSLLCYFNAPNYTFPFDGHDSEKWLFHYLPISWRKFLIQKCGVFCSWKGIAQPVSVFFLNRNLPHFKLATSYYAFDNMEDYMRNYPPFDYMGNPYPSVDVSQLRWKKKLIGMFSKVVGKKMQLLLPVLSVIYIRQPQNHVR